MQSSIDQIKNSKYIIFVFLGVILFQSTMLKFIWSLEGVSRWVNSIILLVTLLLGVHVLLTKNFSGNIWRKYLIPGVLVTLGMILNILINAISNPALLGQLGLTLPWVIYIVIPFFVKRNKINVYTLWNVMYYVMLFFMLTGLIDYYLIYHLGENAEIMKTPYGFFHIGRFSIFHASIDGPHHRFYSCFAEPGSLAMLLLPFIMYAFLKKKYFGMIIFLISFYLTYSLGGYIGLVLISYLLYLYKVKKKDMVLSLLSGVIILGLSYGYLATNFSVEYQKKGNSASEREESFYNGIVNLPTLVVKYPLGMPLAETTDGLRQNSEYTGSNFIPMLYFQSGGILSLLGYVLVLVTSLKYALGIFLSRKIYRVEYVVSACTLVTMVPFLLQRTTIWENSMFALLYAPLILDTINKKNNE